MITLVTDNLDAINALCREYGVLRLELFDSAATGEFDSQRSDIDFLVEYPPGYDFGPWLSRLQDLETELGNLLGRPAQLVMARAMRNPYFIQSVNEGRQLLYEA